MPYLLLACSVVSEVFGSTMLKLSNGFKHKLPIIGVVFGFGIAFYIFSLALVDLPLGFSYAIWSGSGTILTAFVGVFLFQEKINKQGMLGIFLLITGIVMLNIG